MQFETEPARAAYAADLRELAMRVVTALSQGGHGTISVKMEDAELLFGAEAMVLAMPVETIPVYSTKPAD